MAYFIISKLYKNRNNKKKRLNNMFNLFFCRGDRIRTCDHLFPKQARYRTALHPVATTKNYISQLRKWRSLFADAKVVHFHEPTKLLCNFFNQKLFFSYFSSFSHIFLHFNPRFYSFLFPTSTYLVNFMPIYLSIDKTLACFLITYLL